MIYYDANIFLSFFKKKEDSESVFKKKEDSESVKFLFEEGIILNKYPVCFSTYIQLEAMFLFGNARKKPQDIHKLKSIFENKAFTIITLSQETIHICYDLYQDHNIKHPQRDIIHVASAMQSNCKYLVTCDKDFIKTMQLVQGENIPNVLNPDDLRAELGLLSLD